MPPIATRMIMLVDQLRHAIGLFVAREAQARVVVWLGDQAFVPVATFPRLPPVPAHAWPLLSARLARLAARFRALVGRWRAGTLPAPRPPRPSRPFRPPPPRLPRAFGWVNRRIPEAAPPTGQLEALLHDPDTRTLVAAAPQAGRLLRPLCRALGLHPPEWLRLPPRPPRPRPSRPAPPPAPSRDHVPLPDYVRAAARAWNPAWRRRRP